MSREPCFATEFRCGEEALVLSQVRLPEQEDLDLTVLRPVIPWAAPLEDAPSLAALERSAILKALKATHGQNRRPPTRNRQNHALSQTQRMP